MFPKMFPEIHGSRKQLWAFLESCIGREGCRPVESSTVKREPCLGLLGCCGCEETGLKGPWGDPGPQRVSQGLSLPAGPAPQLPSPSIPGQGSDCENLQQKRLTDTETAARGAEKRPESAGTQARVLTPMGQVSHVTCHL